MKTKILAITIILALPFVLLAQKKDSLHIELKPVVVVERVLNEDIGGFTVVDSNKFRLLPKSEGAEEILRFVPGVRVENQHGGERVHVYVRGQGILTEKGMRSFTVLWNGIPLNDPTGFTPDLYDVEWGLVQSVSVSRGASANVFGYLGNSAVISINTFPKFQKTWEGFVQQSAGSNGYLKTLATVGGKNGGAQYAFAFSHSQGDGYRVHQAFRANKFFSAIELKKTSKFKLEQIIGYTHYFHENPEGLNLSQFNDFRQANPDAEPYNEYHLTDRFTLGYNGEVELFGDNYLEFFTFLRKWTFKEASNKSVEHSDHFNPGGEISLHLNFNTGAFSHEILTGADISMQNIEIFKTTNINPLSPVILLKPHSWNFEGDTVLANEIISQIGNGFFFLYNLKVNRLTLTASARYDNITNILLDKTKPSANPFMVKKFRETTFQAGISYSFSEPLVWFANWKQGFTPPTTEELANNPFSYSGFNQYLVPATSQTYETGLKGYYDDLFSYEITTFLMNTQNDFFRFKITERGNQAVFYGNAGNSRRVGVELATGIKPQKNTELYIAYTFSDFRYVSADVNPVFLDTFVLTKPPAPGQFLPNSPMHQLFAQFSYKLKNFTFVFNTDYSSKWAIYTDADAYAGKLDPAIYQPWQDGYLLLNTQLSYSLKLKPVEIEFSAAVRNLTDEKYIAFTEPDPDGNAYQPGPGREFFGSVKIKF